MRSRNRYPGYRPPSAVFGGRGRGADSTVEGLGQAGAGPQSDATKSVAELGGSQEVPPLDPRLKPRAPYAQVTADVFEWLRRNFVWFGPVVAGAVALIVLGVRLDSDVTTLQRDVTDIKDTTKRLTEDNTKNAVRVEGVERRLDLLDDRVYRDTRAPSPGREDKRTPPPK